MQRSCTDVVSALRCLSPVSPDRGPRVSLRLAHPWGVWTEVPTPWAGSPAALPGTRSRARSEPQLPSALVLPAGAAQGGASLPPELGSQVCPPSAGG